MDGHSSTVSLSPSPVNGVQSAYEDESNYESDHAAYDNHPREDSVSSEAESEGLFVEQERNESPASVITLSVSDHEEELNDHLDHESPHPASPVLQGLDQDLYLFDDEPDFDLDFNLERGLDRSESTSHYSDSEAAVGQERDESPGPGLFFPHVGLHELHEIINGHSEVASSDIGQGDHWSEDDLVEAEEADLFGDDYDEADEADEDDAEFLGLPEPVPHHHHHLHHHHFHHPRLPAVHPDRHSPIVVGVNPLQQFGAHFNVNFLPPHLHEHLRRASASPVRPASPHNVPRMDQLVGVELGGPGVGASGRNSRGRAAPNQPEQARANVIDLTLDDEDVEIVGESQNARRQQSQRRNNAPRLNRSDGSYVGNSGNQVIELSSDSEDEVQVNRVNAANAPPAAAPANHHRHHHHHVHHHHVPHHHHHRGAMDRRSPRRVPGANNPRMDEANRGLFNMVGNVFGRMRDRLRDDPVVFLGSSPAPILPIPNVPNIAQIQLDYMAHPFHPPPPPAGAQKPPHVPPPKPRDGFTRDTNDDDVVICPSCEEELAFDPDDDDNGPPLKKARTKKDKAEHHFWGVKECGHVYCRKCYENRKPTVKNPVAVGFKTCPLNSKKILCAVDGCNSDVSSKTAWVGIFL